MSTNTSNFNLIKPELTDPADITNTNINWDIIDAELARLASTVKVYKTVEELNLTVDTATTNDIMQAMGSNTMAILEVNTNWTAATEIPDKYTTMILFKKFNARTVGILISVASQNMWFGSQHSGGSFGGWVVAGSTDSYDGVIPISKGGTGANTKSDALYAIMFNRSNLGGGNGAIDFDNLKEYGNQWINITDNDINPPGGMKFGNYGRFDNFPSHQKFWEYGTGKVWQRFYANGAWQPWYCIGGEDFVVAQGESGSWTYRKWNSGRAELWARIAYTAKLVANAPVEVWINNSFPFQFTSEPSCHINLNHHSTNNHWLVEAKAYTGILNMVKISSSVSGDAGGTADVYISGKWK